MEAVKPYFTPESYNRMGKSHYCYQQLPSPIAFHQMKEGTSKHKIKASPYFILALFALSLSSEKILL